MIYALDSATQRVTEWLSAHTDELIGALAELVRIPSIVGHESDAQTFMRDWYLEADLDIDEFVPSRTSLSKLPAFVDSGFAFLGRPNIIGLFSGAGGGRTLILNGHVDVVSPEPLGAWTYQPFAATIVSEPVPSAANASDAVSAANTSAAPATDRTCGLGRMYGRGTQDMKSGVIANLFAVRALKECGVVLAGDVLLESVIEEEAGGGGGTLACFERGYSADGFIATEPHWDDICTAHPGILYFRVVIEGKSAHAGRAHLGVNAALEAAPIIAMLGEWDKERAATLHFEPFERRDPAVRRSCHLNVGVVRSGDWPSTVPGRCEIEVRMSFVPGETEASVQREIAERLGAVARRSAWLREHPPRIEFFGWHTEPWIQDERHTFVQAFAHCVTDVRTGSGAWLSADERPMLTGITAGLDTRFAGLYGVPALAWGPKGAGLHGANEYVELDSVIDCARTLAVFMMRWCGVR